MQEAEVTREVLVQQPQRMRQVDLCDPVIVAAVEVSETGRRAFAAAVHRHHGGRLERRREEGAGLVREVMLDEAPAFEDAIDGRPREAPRQMMRRAVDQLARRVGDV